MDPIVETLKLQIQKVLDLIKSDLNTVRTGRATPSLVENLVVGVYGGSARMKVMELATIHASDNQTLLITPFDGSIISEIQKGIEVSNTGLNPVIDGQSIRISIPLLSQERRQELIHLMKQKLENGKVMIRQARHEAMNELKKQEESEDEEKRLEKEIQVVIDKFISEIDVLGKKKEEELLQI